MMALTRANLVDSLVQEANLSRPQAVDFLEMTLETIIQALLKEKGVKISSFGSFSVRHKGKRIGRNPKTKKEAIITPRHVLSFKPSQYLRERIQKHKN